MASYGAVDDKFINRLKHSRLGIASFVLFVVSVIGLSSFFVYILFHSSEKRGTNEENILFIVTMTLIFVGGGSSLTGLIQGIVGVFQKNRNRLFAVLGSVSNGLVILTFIIVIILGIMARPH